MEMTFTAQMPDAPVAARPVLALALAFALAALALPAAGQAAAGCRPPPAPRASPT